jgi:hypothetical protein
MAEVEISRVEPAPRGGIGVHTRFHSRRCTSIVAFGISALPPT